MTDWPRKALYWALIREIGSLSGKSRLDMADIKKHLPTAKQRLEAKIYRLGDLG